MNISRLNANTLMMKEQSSYQDTLQITSGGPSLRGEIIAGYGLRTDPITGISSLDETVLRQHNEIVLGGTIYALEKLFNVSSDLKVAYLNDIMGIGLDGPAINERYPKDNAVCLFNIGIGGCGAAYTDVKDVLQQQRSLDTMIPFRIVDEKFSVGTEEKEKYAFCKQDQDGKYWYYLKKFSKTPVIKALWKDAGNGNDGSAVVETDHLSKRTTPIETFAEAILTVEVTDLREYFELYSSIDQARFNTMGLCTGIKSTLADGSEEYKQVTQFSALNFSNEMLHMNKDLTIIYRVYSA
jgi:hypothetical protein